MKTWILAPFLAAILLTPVASAQNTERFNPLLNNPEKLEEIAAAFGLSVETLTAELEGGETLREIAVEYKVSKKTVEQYMKHKHKNHPPKALTVEMIEKIAEELDLSTEEVKKAMKDHALKDLFIEQGVDMKSFMESIGAPKPKF